MEGEEMETKDESLKSQIAVRSAKAAFLLWSLRSHPNRHQNRTDDEAKGIEMLMKEAADLKLELARERSEKRQIRLCSLIEVVLQIFVVLSLSSLCLMIAFGCE